MSKFLISVGHTASGQTGCGAVGFLDESYCTREIAPLVVEKLKAAGHTAVKLQVDTWAAQADYVIRTAQANAQGGDYFVEIHLNAGGGTGCEVYTTSGSRAGSLAGRVSSYIADEIGIADRGYKTTSGLYVLNHTSMPAMLIECCFVDNYIDYKAYNAEMIATAIAEGLTGKRINSSSGTWKVDSKGWWFRYSDGTWPTGWAKLPLSNNDSATGWFLFNSQGYMEVQWKNPDGNWYYLGEENDGRARQNEWAYDNKLNKWYYFDDNCVMVQSKWIKYKNEWYYLKADGSMATGWIEDGGKWYLLYSNGVMAHDTTMYGYAFASDGTATKV